MTPRLPALLALSAVTACAALAGSAMTIAPAAADDPPGPVQILPRWKKGDRLAFEMVKTKVKSQGGKVVQKGVARTPVRIEVTEATKTGFLVRWTHGETRLDDPAQDNNPVVRKMANLVNGVHAVFRFDADGTLEGIENWKEVKEVTGKIADTLAGELRRAGMDAATVEKIIGQAKAMLETREQIEQFCFKEAHIFFAVLGDTYTPGKPGEYQDELPNPLGGEPFPTRVTRTLKGFDKATGRAVIALKQSIDPKAAARIMDKTLKDLAAKLGKPAPGGEAMREFRIADAAEFTIDAGTGWIIHLTHTRTATTGTISQEETVTFTRKP
jgi:hypothetical protein